MLVKSLVVGLDSTCGSTGDRAAVVVYSGRDWVGLPHASIAAIICLLIWPNPAAYSFT